MNQLEERLADLFSGGELIRMIFSSKRKKSVEYNKVPMRISPVKLLQHWPCS